MTIQDAFKKIGVFTLACSIVLLQSCNGNKQDNNEDSQVASTDSIASGVAIPAVINYEIVKDFPHDATSFTEGLQYIDGILFESAGQYGQSDVRKTELQTGKVIQQRKLDARYFGEGLSVLNGKLYQLTYKERTAFVYDAATLKPLKTFSFETGEGWGLTNDGTNLIMSDGTSTVYFLDPATFKEVKRITVTDQYGPVTDINELEYIKGYVYANKWRQDVILKIDPQSGKIVGIADLSTFRGRAGIPYPVDGNETAPETMNGIAYDAGTNKVYITGKNWPKLFEIKLDN